MARFSRLHYSLLSIVIILIFAAVIACGWWWNSGTGVSAQMIEKDLQTLSTVFKQIDADCTIVGFTADTIPVNFLTVKKDGFVGKEIGSMILKHPAKWNGPYLKNNVHVSGKEYQIVLMRDGYAIVPGQGVTLPNGKVIGTDIVIDKNMSLAEASQSFLLHKGTPLAIPLPVTVKKCLVGQEQVLFPESE